MPRRPSSCQSGSQCLLGIEAELTLPDPPELPADPAEFSFPFHVGADLIRSGVRDPAVAFHGQAAACSADDKVNPAAAYLETVGYVVSPSPDGQKYALLE